MPKYVEVLDRLLSQPVTTWRGRYYTAVDARMIPGCLQRPRIPIVVAAGGPRAFQVAARYGQGWCAAGRTSPEQGAEAWWREVSELQERCDEVLASVGREPSTLDRYLALDPSPVYSLSCIEAFRDAVGRAAEIGYTDVMVHWPRREGIYHGDEAILEDVAAELPRWHG